MCEVIQKFKCNRPEVLYNSTSYKKFAHVLRKYPWWYKFNWGMNAFNFSNIALHYGCDPGFSEISRAAKFSLTKLAIIKSYSK